MSQLPDAAPFDQLQVHPWLKQINLCFVPGPGLTPLAQSTIDGLLPQFTRLGHTVQDKPDDDTDIIITTAPYGEPLPWRKAIALVGRMQFGYKHSPTIFTLVHLTPAELESRLAYFDQVLAKDPMQQSDFDFPGLAPTAYKVLYEQGNRGGPILALERLIQAQAKSIQHQDTDAFCAGKKHPCLDAGRR